MRDIKKRKETSKLYFDLTDQNLHCCKQTSLLGTPANRDKLKQMVEHIRAKLLLDVLDFASYLPNNKILENIKTAKIIKSKYIKAIPSCGEFIVINYKRLCATRRHSFRVTISSIIWFYLKYKLFAQLLGKTPKASVVQFSVELCKVKRCKGAVILSQQSIIRDFFVEAFIAEKIKNYFYRYFMKYFNFYFIPAIETLLIEGEIYE